MNKFNRLMYAAKICKACLRTCERKCTGNYFSVASQFIKDMTIINRNFISGRLCFSSLLSSWRGQNKKSGFCGLKTVFSTGKDSLASVPEDAQKITESIEESLDTLTDGPPEELVQSSEEENRQKWKLLWMELQVIRQKGYAVPRKMSLLQWQEAMKRETRSQKIKFCQYLCRKEARKERKSLKKKANLQEHKRMMAARDLSKATDSLFNECDNGLSKNAIFLPIPKNNMNVVYNSWQCQAIQFGQSIVIDLGFDDHMSKWEALNCAQQITTMYGFNKVNRQPFYLHLCNASPDNRVLQFVEQFIPNLYSHMCMIKVTEKNYLDVFPKEKLMYLSPHCKNELLNFDHDAVYIMGGIVDKVIKRPVSTVKAKTEGISVACLPLDHYIEWGQGTKSLTLDQMIKILLDIKNIGSWNTALKHIPMRKLKRVKT